MRCCSSSKRALVKSRRTFIEVSKLTPKRRCCGSPEELLPWGRPRLTLTTTRSSRIRSRVEPFFLDRCPVTACDWASFISEGGYDERGVWSPEGWDWRTSESIAEPEYWVDAGNRFVYRGPLGLREIDPHEPVCGISWYEADAYARWNEKRLPTEAEWEYAASHTPNAKRLYPWGDEAPDPTRASFAINRWDPGPIGQRPDGASFYGILDMAGEHREWTSSPFLPYPGFEAFPYDGYSKDHMDGKHFVCRGGSWATAAPILRCTFRNWYVPTYRQGFLGLRCAR